MVGPRSALKREFMDFDADGVRVRVAALARQGELTPVIFLHGFGSTKEDYADAALHACFEDRTILALDAPGCGESGCADLPALSLSMICDVLKSMVRQLDLPPFHLVGHSMGDRKSVV